MVALNKAERSTKNKARLDLQERIKELSCLYNVARLAARTELSLDEVLNGIAGCLPAAWRYPDQACARILYNGRSYSTANFQCGPYKQKAMITIGNKRRGTIEVSYAEKEWWNNTDLFLQEEQHLLDAVAKEVSAIILRRETAQDKIRLEEQLRHADRLATVGQLAAGVAHELNEPLGHMLGFAQLIRKRSDVSDQVLRDIEKIIATSLHAREIVKKLLIFARQVPPQKTRVNLNELMKEGLAFFESRFANEGVNIVCIFTPETTDVEADPSQLNQVFVNLIVNALHAMPAGGELRISTYRKPRKICVAIEDTGTGMDKDVLKKIFTPFFTTKDIGLGTGLGLPVAHGIISSHGGSIKIDSEAGKGTVCRIELPAPR